MSVEVRVPALGESVVEATVGAWLKQPGEAVQAGEPLVQLETEKVNVDVSAERSGTLEKVEHAEGDVVHPGDVLGLLGEGAPSADGRSETSPSPAATPSTAEDRPPASPVARRLAEEHEVDLSQVTGTGTAGRVTREDVERYLSEHRAPAAPSAQQVSAAPSPQSTPGSGSAQPAPATSGGPPAPAPPPAFPQSPAPTARPTPPAPPAPASGAARGTETRREERVRMSRRRQTIAQRLVEAQHQAAMLTTFNEADMSAVMEVRARRKERFHEQHGVSLGFMSFFTKAVVGALRAFPSVNAEIQGDEIVVKRYYDIGIAVGVEEGLVVPVVRDADRKSFAEIEREVADLAEKARTGRLTLDDLRGGTFTITNGGIYGSLLSTPILNAPQVGILGMHRIQQRPVAIDGQVMIRPMMYLAVSYDHRVVDGQQAVQFLVRVRELVEDPERLLLEG